MRPGSTLPRTAVFLLLAALGCASDDIGVSATYDPLVRFPKSATYAWNESASSLPDDPEIQALDLDPRIRQVVGEELAKRGYRAASTAPPDYRLSYQLGVNRWISAERSSAFGSLSLLLVDAKSGRRVWMGFARAEVLVGLSDTERRARLQNAVARMLEDFPPSQRGD